jgi:glycosyltransferase involved in cell wall biosynthesis
LLSKLEEQETEGFFDYSIVVVDNHRTASAQPVVESFARQSQIPISYYVEPEQNIALARNRAVENARGDFIAFIDDDEFPPNNWLLNMFTSCTRFAADGVLGPVKPHFDENCPSWIIKAKVCERPTHPTGMIMHATDTRTGNLLLKREIFDDVDNRFDPQYGRSGGEDVWFFVKVIGKGRVFVWCDDAPVYETVIPERWKMSYYVLRSVRIGGLTGEEVRTKGLSGPSVTRVIAASCGYSLILPLAVFFGKHIFLRFLVKSAYSVAFLLGYCGHVIIRHRND